MVFLFLGAQRNQAQRFPKKVLKHLLNSGYNSTSKTLFAKFWRNCILSHASAHFHMLVYFYQKADLGLKIKFNRLILPESSVKNVRKVLFNLKF